MSKYENEKLCAKCQGMCCKRMGCHFSPDDINGGITYENLKKLLNTGSVSIDWWEEDPREELTAGVIEVPRAYYLRMRNKNAPIVDDSWGGECILLTTKGCSLDFKYRPKGARMLVPSEEGCVAEYSKQQCAIDWIKYEDILRRLVDEN